MFWLVESTSCYTGYPLSTFLVFSCTDVLFHYPHTTLSVVTLSHSHTTCKQETRASSGYVNEPDDMDYGLPVISGGQRVEHRFRVKFTYRAALERSKKKTLLEYMLALRIQVKYFSPLS
jgi:hypothetical protein